MERTPRATLAGQSPLREQAHRRAGAGRNRPGRNEVCVGRGRARESTLHEDRKAGELGGERVGARSVQLRSLTGAGRGGAAAEGQAVVRHKSSSCDLLHSL